MAIFLLINLINLMLYSPYFVPIVTLSSSSSVSWPSLQRSGCSTISTHGGPLSWATASGFPHSSACRLTWSTTCLMQRAHSNRYRMILFTSLVVQVPRPPRLSLCSVLSPDLYSPADMSPTTGIASRPSLSTLCHGLPSPVNA